MATEQSHQLLEWKKVGSSTNKITAKYRCRATEEVCNKWMQCVTLAKKVLETLETKYVHTTLPKITVN